MIISDLSDFVFGLLYALEKYILYLIDFITDIFAYLSGLKLADSAGTKKDILIFFTESDSISEPFYMVLLIGVIMLFVFTALSVIKSESEEDLSKKSKGKIILGSFKGFILMLIFPFVMLALVYLSSALLSSVYLAVNGEEGKASLIGGELFINSAYSAYSGDEGVRDYVERHFLSGEYSYMDVDTVKKFYSLEKINYVTGIFLPLLILAMLFLCTMSFTERIFASLFLYIISPLICATYPLDNGYRFREFKELLISELLSSYGIVVLMGILGIIMPEINSLTFTPSGFEDGLIKVIILTGGIYAVTKGDRLLSRIIHGGETGGGITEIISVVKGGIGAVKTGAAYTAGAYRNTEGKMQEKRAERKENIQPAKYDKKTEEAIKNAKTHT